MNERETALRALKRYGRHDPVCGPFKCSCGYDAAIATLESDQPVEGKFTIHRNDGGHAETIEENGRTVLWLNPGTVRGEENVERLVSLMNAARLPAPAVVSRDEILRAVNVALELCFDDHNDCLIEDGQEIRRQLVEKVHALQLPQPVTGHAEVVDLLEKARAECHAGNPISASQTLMLALAALRGHGGE